MCARRKPERINERASERGLSFFVERGGKIIRRKEEGGGRREGKLGIRI